MSTGALLLLVAAMAVLGYLLGKYRALATVGGGRGIRRLHSLPSYYGLLAALWCALPCLVVLVAWLALEERILGSLVVAGMGEAAPADPVALGLLVNDVRNVLSGAVPAGLAEPGVRAAAAHYARLQSTARLALAGVVLALGVLAILVVRVRISPELRARNAVEKTGETLLLACASLAVFVTAGIVASVVYESFLFFRAVPVTEFLFGLEWSPQTAMRADQVASEGRFGAVPLFLGTLMIAGIAMLIAVPVGLFSAIYLAEYAGRRFRAWAKPMLEVLAGIPTVVYGFFAALTVGPALRAFGESVGLDVASGSALAAGLVMGVMIIPFVSSLADDMICAVPQSLRDGAYALGATRSEAIRQVVLPAALPGIVGGVLLAVSRAIGETMIVVMAAGLAANLTANPLQAVTTVTVQIVTLLTGDQEFDSPKTLAAFALGLMLFITTLVLNVIALYVVRRYREQYE
ncbi:MAG: phosphate ABC transporter permease subunit PstC [Pseudomonadota bacterium]|jgi:phosphate transport system permease protein|nr:MAG: phosphate ABC transporter permease subunit PstC [Pseudomonadota bacterium]